MEEVVAERINPVTALLLAHGSSHRTVLSFIALDPQTSYTRLTRPHGKWPKPGTARLRPRPKSCKIRFNLRLVVLASTSFHHPRSQLNLTLQSLSCSSSNVVLQVYVSYKTAEIKIMMIVSISNYSQFYTTFCLLLRQYQMAGLCVIFCHLLLSPASLFIASLTLAGEAN